MKRSLTGGLVGTATGLPPALAHAPWWATLMAVFAGELVFLISLCMTYGVVKSLVERPFTGSFKGACDVELKASEPSSPEPEPHKPKRWPRRKPPPTS